MTLPKNTLPIPLLNLTVGFNPVEGKLWWLERGPHWFQGAKNPLRESRRWNTRYAGAEAFGTLSHYGYKTGRILGKSFYAHRVMWALMMQEWPSGFLDHINGDKTDNRITNLREAPKLLNNKNARKRKDNKSGEPCIRVRGSGKFEVVVGLDGSYHYLGSYDDLQMAVAIRDNFWGENGYTERHGK